MEVDATTPGKVAWVWLPEDGPWDGEWEPELSKERNVGSLPWPRNRFPVVCLPLFGLAIIEWLLLDEELVEELFSEA